MQAMSRQNSDDSHAPSRSNTTPINRACPQATLKADNGLTLAGVLAPDRLVREKPPPSTRQMCEVLFRLLGGNELLAVRSVIKDVWTFAIHSWKGPKTLGATATPGTSTNA
jgi:hypothetical protein